MRHHYIPGIYLKRWAGPDGRLCEFSRPYGPRVKPRRTAPSGTGYEDWLYGIRGAKPDVANVVEQRFFKVMDDQAARVLDRLEIEGPGGDWSISERSAWARFLLSLALRAPSDVATLRNHWEATFRA